MPSRPPSSTPEIANGPAYGRGTWEQPKGLYGVAQLSPWLLFPLDGLNLAQGTNGQLFGSATCRYRSPNPRPTPATSVGRCSSTAAPSKGPVAFFTPYFWSRSVEVHPEFAGMLLDSRPSDANKAFQMETQYVPAAIAVDAADQTYARVAPTSFPAGDEGNTVVLHRLTSYSRQALWNGVKAWFDGGEPVDGRIDARGVFVQHFKDGGNSTWQIYAERTPKLQKVAIDWRGFGTPFAPEPTT